ncbi:MAG: hypothetical protein R2867_20840 [Caldilineaceae bacterium]
MAWGDRGHLLWSTYDALQRPLARYVKGADPQDPQHILQFERIIYGDTPNNGLTDPQRLRSICVAEPINTLTRQVW